MVPSGGDERSLPANVARREPQTQPCPAVTALDATGGSVNRCHADETLDRRMITLAEILRL